MARILVLHGPNLNLLGTREPELYGNTTLSELNQQLQQQAQKQGQTLTCLQSNAEHELVDAIQQAAGNVDFIIFNPAAYTHTSVALRDALLAVGIAFIEVHLTNPYNREEFRQRSYFSDIAIGTITGLGKLSYTLALEAAIQKLNQK